MGGRRWSDEEKQILTSNYKLKTTKELTELLNRTESAINDMVSVLGLVETNHWSKEENEQLTKIWGKPRKLIEKAFPKHNWTQIRTHAIVYLKLEQLKIERNAVSLYYILEKMEYNSSIPKKWRNLGLKITEDKGKKDKLGRLYVNIDDFWNFVLEHTDIVDIHRLPEGYLGVEPLKIRELRSNSKAKPRIKKPTKEEKIQAVKLYYNSGLMAEELAERLGITADSFRHIASEMKKEGLVSGKKVFRTTRTKKFLQLLERLYYVDGLSQKQCKDKLAELGHTCSLNSVQRGLSDIRIQMTNKANKNNN